MKYFMLVYRSALRVQILRIEEFTEEFEARDAAHAENILLPGCVRLISATDITI